MKNKVTYGFDSSGGLPLMAVHVFTLLDSGDLLHEINGVVRAQVPPEGFESYVETWPECADVVATVSVLVDNTESAPPADEATPPPPAD